MKLPGIPRAATVLEAVVKSNADSTLDRHQNCPELGMKYKVTFRKRFNREGEPSDNPSQLVSVPDGVIQDATVIERFEPPSTHVEERLEEDDDFLAFGTEVWEYDVTEGREQEFKDALVNSEVVLEFEEIQEELLT